MFRIRRENVNIIEGVLIKEIIEIQTDLMYYIPYGTIYYLNGDRINKDHALRLIHKKAFNNILEEMINE